METSITVLTSTMSHRQKQSKYFSINRYCYLKILLTHKTKEDIMLWAELITAENYT